jgi:hypothetical protein
VISPTRCANRVLRGMRDGPRIRWNCRSEKDLSGARIILHFQHFLQIHPRSLAHFVWHLCRPSEGTAATLQPGGGMHPRRDSVGQVEKAVSECSARAAVFRGMPLPNAAPIAISQILHLRWAVRLTRDRLNSALWTPANSPAAHASAACWCAVV